MSDIDLNELDPGCRNFVAFLREHQFDTTDSGDGSKYPEMECALEFPMVAIQCDVDLVISESKRLHQLLSDHGLYVEMGMIQSSYDPTTDYAMIVILDEDDKFIKFWKSESPSPTNMAN